MSYNCGHSKKLFDIESVTIVTLLSIKIIIIIYIATIMHLCIVKVTEDCYTFTKIVDCRGNTR